MRKRMFGLRYREDLQTGQTSILVSLGNKDGQELICEYTVFIPAVDPLGCHDEGGGVV
jgi:hypothetical protein